MNIGLFYKKDKPLLNSPSLSQIAHAIENVGLSIENLEVKKNGEWMQVKMVKQNLLALPVFDFVPTKLRSEFCDEVLQSFIKEYPLNDKNEMFHWVPVVAMLLKK